DGDVRRTVILGAAKDLRLPVAGCRLPVAGCREGMQQATGNRQLATGNWQLATGNWQLEVNMFERFASWGTRWSGSTTAFILASASIVLWLVTGPMFHWSDTWQLVANTVT